MKNKWKDRPKMNGIGLLLPSILIIQVFALRNGVITEHAPYSPSLHAFPH